MRNKALNPSLSYHVVLLKVNASILRIHLTAKRFLIPFKGFISSVQIKSRLSWLISFVQVHGFILKCT